MGVLLVLRGGWCDGLCHAMGVGVHAEQDRARWDEVLRALY
jgi:hypothetical protein